MTSRISRWLELNHGLLQRSLDRGIGDRLCPQFAIGRLLSLCDELPKDCMDYDVAVGQDPSATPRMVLSGEETVRRIAESRPWVAPKYAGARGLHPRPPELSPQGDQVSVARSAG